MRRSQVVLNLPTLTQVASSFRANALHDWNLACTCVHVRQMKDYVIGGQVSCLQELVDTGRSSLFSTQDNYGDTILHVYLRCTVDKNVDVVRLLAKHSNLSLVNNKGCTVLSEALQEQTQFSCVEIWECLITPENVCIANSSGEYPIHQAVMHQNWDFVQRVFDLCSFQKNGQGKTPLHLALQHGPLAPELYSLIYQSNVNDVDLNGDTPLHVFVRSFRGTLDMCGYLYVQNIENLVQQGASTNTTNALGYTPLHILCAIKKCEDSSSPMDTKILIDLLATDQNINLLDVDGNSAFLLALSAGNWATALELVCRGTDVLATNHKGQNAMHIALHERNNSSNIGGHNPSSDLLMKLANQNCDILCSSVQSQSANRCFDLLLQTLSLSDRDLSGRTVLHYAVLLPCLGVFHGYICDVVIVVASRFDTANKVLSELHPRTSPCNVCSNLVGLISKDNINLKDNAGDTALHLALRWQSAAYGLLMEAGADVNLANDKGQTALHEAAMSGMLRREGCLELAILCSDISQQDSEGNAPLHLATDKKVLSLLIARGADVNIRNAQGATPLHSVLKSKDMDEDVICSKYISDINKSLPDDQGREPIHYAAMFRRMVVLKKLIEQGCLLNNPTLSKDTPLHLTLISYKSTKISEAEKVLTTWKSLASDDALRQINIDGNSVLHLAMQNGWLTFSHWLLEKGLDANLQNVLGNTPLHEFLQNLTSFTLNDEHINSLALFVTNANINMQSHSGDTYLHLALSRHYPQLVPHLLVAGADVNIRNSSCMPPLLCAFNGFQYASDHGRSVIRSLATRDNINCHDGNGNTALHLAAIEQEWGDVNYFISLGADVEALTNSSHNALMFGLFHAGSPPHELITSNVVRQQNLDGDTVLHIAMRSSNSNIIGSLLYDHDADVNIQNAEGKTPLHYMCKDLMDAPWREKLVSDVNIKIRDKEGNTPLHAIAKLTSISEEFISVLLQHGADLCALNLNGFTPFDIMLHCNSAMVPRLRALLPVIMPPAFLPRDVLAHTEALLTLDDHLFIAKALHYLRPYQLWVMRVSSASISFHNPAGCSYQQHFTDYKVMLHISRLILAGGCCRSYSVVVTTMPLFIASPVVNFKNEQLQDIRDVWYTARSTPRSLSEACSRTIRNVISRLDSETFETLPLPPRLIKYLQLMHVAEELGNVLYPQSSN